MVERPAARHGTAGLRPRRHQGPRFPTLIGRFWSTKTTRWWPPSPTHRCRTVADLLRDGVDSESWYNEQAHPYWRLQRDLQYEGYILHDVLPLMWPELDAHHRHRLPLRRLSRYQLSLSPSDKVTGCVTMGGSFDIRRFLDGFRTAKTCTSTIPLITWRSAPIARATTTYGRCSRPANGTCAGAITRAWPRSCGRAAFVTSPYVWGDRSYHDWPWWRPMSEGVSWSRPLFASRFSLFAKTLYRVGDQSLHQLPAKRSLQAFDSRLVMLSI